MKYDLVLDPPIMNAAGTLGFAPDPNGAVELSRLGAFVTNPVSRLPRSPAQGVRCLPYPGGFLLHTGHPNPGLKAVIRRYAERWARSPAPVLVHLLGQTPGEVGEMRRRLEGLEGVAGLELGLPPQVDAQTAAAMTRAAMGEKPVVVRLPLERALELAMGMAAAMGGAMEVTAFSLAPPRGTLNLPGGGSMQGRMYGPGVYPLALRAVQELHAAGLPVIGAGGVYQVEQAEAMLAAGAMAVQLDAVLWRGGLS